MTASPAAPEGTQACCACCSSPIPADMLAELRKSSTATICPSCHEALRVAMLPAVMH